MGSSQGLPTVCEGVCTQFRHSGLSFADGDLNKHRLHRFQFPRTQRAERKPIGQIPVSVQRLETVAATADCKC